MMSETLTRLFHRLTLLTEAESEDPEFRNLPIRQRRISARILQQLPPEEQQDYSPGRILYYVKVDVQDFDRLQQYTWVEDQRGYIYTTISVPGGRGHPDSHTGRPVFLPSFILQGEGRVYQRRRSTEEDKRDFRRSNLYSYAA